jgi:TP53 regulating kinase-like protein
MELIAQGAEAKLYKEKEHLIKERIKKNYRIAEIDDALRKKRTRKEAKILEKINHLGFAPKLISNDDKSKITMEFIEGKTLRDYLTKDNFKGLMQELGRKIAILHNHNIIHGDLTTSNFIVQKDNNSIFFIDFGLAFESDKVEDKAVDIHLLKQALESKHYQIWEECFKEALASYEKECKNAREVFQRLETVEKRGRYKHK